MRYLLLVIFVLFVNALTNSTNLLAQAETPGDLKLIENNSFEQPAFYHKREVHFGIQKSDNFFRKYNPLNLVFSGLMFTYQRWISPQISADCLYNPTCSSYCKSLFHEYGFLRGVIYSSDRIMRCDRISATTIHPVSIHPSDGKVHEHPDRYKIIKSGVSQYAD
jgi:putative membrane protein insertion efficiency factor